MEFLRPVQTEALACAQKNPLIDWFNHNNGLYDNSMRTIILYIAPQKQNINFSTMKKSLFKLALGAMLSLFFVSNSLSQPGLPSDFPLVDIKVYGEPDTGLLFLSTSVEAEGVGNYVFAVNNKGEVVKYKHLPNDYAYDFKVQPNGLMSYAQFLSHHDYTGGGDVEQVILDEDMNIVDIFQMQNEYIAEAHDFQLLPNGHALIFGYYMTEMDLTDVVTGGFPNALVSGGIIQELDAEKNVVWQWRSWDNYNYKEYPFGRRSNQPKVSSFHLNTIELDPVDNNIILGSPDWSKKIDRQTGVVKWVLGGAYNEFSFVGVDSVKGIDMTTGHTFHRAANGNYIIFDNSDRTRKKNAQIQEFSLDEENKIATHIRTITPEKFYSSWHRGSAQLLPNGNYLAGWGGALAGDTIPAATEYTPDGKKVLEYFFKNPLVESYRAVKHTFPMTYSAKGYAIEVARGNSYDFLDMDDKETGMGIKINAFDGEGYNEVIAMHYNYGPKYPEFPGRAPIVLNRRVVVEEHYLKQLKGNLILDVEALNIAHPEKLTVYHRPFRDKGLFIPLTTVYNDVKNEISASFNAVGEFVLGYPDIEHKIYSAKPVLNANNEILPNGRAVKIEWAPKGFFNGFQLQVSEKEDFSSLHLDVSDLRPTIYYLNNLKENTQYFWRVKTTNDDGVSDWSTTGSFSTGEIKLTVTQPNGDEIWKRGLDHFIKWEYNDTSDVVLDLYKFGIKISNIDTVDNIGSYKWEIPSSLDESCGYFIKVSSVNNAGISDFNDKSFALNNATCQNVMLSLSEKEVQTANDLYPNPTTDFIHWSGNVDIASVCIYNIAGRKIKTLEINNGIRTFDLNFLKKGAYLLQITDFNGVVYNRQVLKK
jgi:hypothetical protein